jgi:hypothetical protein
MAMCKFSLSWCMASGTLHMVTSLRTPTMLSLEPAVDSPSLAALQQRIPGFTSVTWNKIPAYALPAGLRKPGQRPDQFKTTRMGVR